MSKFQLRLYVSGTTRTSLEAVEIIKSICADELKGNCELEIIDINENPDMAEDDGILAIPTLIKRLPAPEQRLIGALTIRTRVLAGLGLPTI